jgi:hypothetical protein
MSPIKNEILTVYFSIIDQRGNLAWEEKHFVETNQLGLFSVDICKNSDNYTDGYAATPDAIDWSNTSHTLTVKIDDEGNMINLGTHMIMAVPYALYASDSPDADPLNEIQDLQLEGNLLNITGNPNATSIDLSTLNGNNDNWQRIGDHLVYIDGNVGIGTDAPFTKLMVNGATYTHGLELPNNFGPDTSYVGTPGNYIAFGHIGISEDFIGYKDNTFYLKDSPEGGDVRDPNLVVGGNLAVGTDQFTGSGLAVQGSVDLVSEDPLFEVKRKDGNTVFAVYNDGVRVFVEEGAKSAKGGFAVGGYNASTKGLTNEYMYVSPDSVRIYINDELTADPAKGVKGGFAVGGYNKSKGFSREFLRVTDDSTRVYVDDDPAKGVKGGFAVGGYNKTKSTSYDFLSLTPDNYFIGHESGSSITTGLYNSFIGYEAGKNTTTGLDNIFIGYKSGLLNTEGNYNIFIGDLAGNNNTTGEYNIFQGLTSGFFNTTGNYNAYIGYESGFSGGYLSTSPSYNTFLGYQTGLNNRSGEYNTFIGYQAGHSGTNASGNNNVFIGANAGMYNVTGGNNVFIGNGTGVENNKGKSNVIIGHLAGYLNNGDYNVFIGYESGYNNINGSDSRYSKWNTFIGYQSGRENTYGWHNLAIGYRSGYTNQTATNQFFLGNRSGESLTEGYANTFVGHLTGRYSTNVSDNTFIGYQAGYRNYTGARNTFIGSAAGLDAEGSGNVFIGNRVGWYEDGDDLLYIDNSSTSSPLIYGNFSSDFVRINNKLGVGINPTTNFAVAGLTGTTSGAYVRWSGNNFYYYSSSRDTKEDIHPLQEDFYKILAAEPVSFIDKATGEPHIGYIAEEFDEKGLEKLVIYMDGKPSALSYELITIYNLEIIKDQQEQLEQKDAEIENLKARLSEIEAVLGM